MGPRLSGSVMALVFPLIGDDLLLQERVDLLTAMLDSSLDARVSIDSAGIVQEWNWAAEAMFGFSREEAIGEKLHSLIIPPESVALHLTGMARLKAGGNARILARRIEVEAIGKAGNRFPVELAISPFRFRGQTFYVGQIRDIEGRKAFERQLHLVAKELDHRVKNTMAIMISIARQTGKVASSVPDFLRSFESRAISYKRTHDLLSISQYQGVDLRAILLAEFEPYRVDHQIELSGPDVFLPQRIALALGMCIHEMTTNAVKHGALSVVTGAVFVRWQVTSEDLVIHWAETGGPDPGRPTRKGFGSVLIKTGLESDLKGRFDVEFKPSGLHAEVTIPLWTKSQSDKREDVA